MKQAVLLLLLAPGLVAQTPVGPGQVGAMYCMAVQRAQTQVQTYCYQYPANPTWVLVHNTIDNLPAGGGSLVVTFNWCNAFSAGSCTGDAITWQFVWDGTTLQWEYTADGGALQTGIFGPLASAACVQTLCTVALNASTPADLIVQVFAYPNGATGPATVTIPAGALAAQFSVAFMGASVALNPSVSSWAYGNQPQDAFRSMTEPVFSPAVWMAGIP